MISEPTQEKDLMNAECVGKPIDTVPISFNPTGSIMGRNHILVMNVEIPLLKVLSSWITKEPTLERNLMNAVNVGKLLFRIKVLPCTRYFTLGRNPLSVMTVGSLSVLIEI